MFFSLLFLDPSADNAVLYVQRWHEEGEAGTVPTAHRRTNQMRDPEDDRPWQRQVSRLVAV
jgi:hypothetical protein